MPDGAGGPEVGRISIRVVPDTTGFREKVRAETQGADADVKVDVKPKIEKTEFEKALAEAKAAAKSAGIKLDIDFRDTAAEAKLAGVIAKLKAEAAAANIKLRVDVDKTRGLPNLGFGGLGSSGANAGLAGIGNFGTPANLLAIATLIPPAVSMASQALVSLPAAIAGIAIPLGTLAIGLGGLKQALVNAGDVVLDKKGNLGVGPAIKALQDQVSGVFEKGFTPLFQKLNSNVLPVLIDGMPKVAQGLVDLAGGVVNALTSGPGLDAIRNLFSNIGTALSTAGPGMGAFVTGLVNLASVVSNHFPGMAKWFDDLGARFSGWVDKISANGTLDKAISGMKPILDAVVNFAGRLLDAGVKLASDPAMSDNIRKLVDTISDLAIEALPGLAKAFDILATSLDKINHSMPPGAGFGNKLTDVSKIPGAGAIGDVNNIPGAGFGRTLAVDIARSFQTLPGILGPLWAQIVSTASAALGQLPGIAGAAFSAIVGAAKQAFGQAVAEATTGVANIINEVKGLGSKVVAACSNFGSLLVQAGKDLIGGLVNGIRSMAGAVMDAIGGVAHNVVDTAKSLLGIHSPSTVMNEVGQDTMQGLADGMDAGTASVVSRAQAVAQKVTEALTNGIQPSVGSSGLGGAAQRAISQAESMVGESYVSGISDCSGAVSQVFSAMSGKKTHFTTMADFEALGFKPGFKPGALNIGVTPLPGQSGHMAATLPDGRNFESGGTSSVVKLGAGAAGALDKQFSERFYYDGGGLSAFKDQLADVASLSDDVKNAMAELTVERKKLKVEFDQAPDKDTKKRLRDEMDKLDVLKDQLSVQQSQLGLQKDQLSGSDGDLLGRSGRSGTQSTDYFSKLGRMGYDFAKANVSQFESDIGISGKGAIPVIAEQGINWVGTALGGLVSGLFGGQAPGTTNIHVNSVDEALAVKQREDNKRALQYVGRG